MGRYPIDEGWGEGARPLPPSPCLAREAVGSLGILDKGAAGTREYGSAGEM